MKPARIIVLLIALAAGGIAAFMASRSDQAPPPAPAAPIAQLETTDVLVANAEIGMGTAVKPEDLRWQTWPAAASANFIRKSDRRFRLHGGHIADRHACRFDRHIDRHRGRRVRPPQRPCRCHSQPA
jgi:Flp pilus assembly protein CpaB